MSASAQIRRGFGAIALTTFLAVPVAASPAAESSSLERCKDVVIRTGNGAVYTRTH
jgi:hypothetical protein